MLLEGHEVWAFDDLNAFYNPARKEQNLKELKALGKPFHFVKGDLTQQADLNHVFSLAKFDQVIHLAARAGVRPSLADPILYQQVNVIGTVAVLEKARELGIRKITIASSSSVYGISSNVPFSETEPIFTPISPYATSKLACEGLGHVYHHIYGMDVAMLRFFTVYGPRQRPDLAIHKFAQLITEGKPIPVFGDGSTSRDYTFVADTVAGIMACTRMEIGYEIINLGESQTVRLDYLIELIEKEVGKKALINRLPDQPGDVPITFANITKARRILGYNPQVKIEEGMHRFMEWFKRQPPLS